MKNKFSTLSFLNKIQVATPLTLLLGCDGSRGDESFVALVATGILAILLSLFDGYYETADGLWKLWRLVTVCVLVSVFVYTVELTFFWKLGTLHGPIGYYGISLTLSFLFGMFMLFGLLGAWADNHAKLKH